MPAYVEVEQIETPTCDEGEFCDPHENPAHHVRVKIGPAILSPFGEALAALEILLANYGNKEIAEHDNDMTGHAADSCALCLGRAALKRGRRVLKFISKNSL